MPYVARLAGLVLLVTLGGCAASSAPPARPADFPNHTPGELVTLHWRVDRGDGVATAVGVAEIGPVDRISEVTLTLEGLDREGRVVSRAVDILTPQSFVGEALRPFTLRLRPTGQEDRFALRALDVTWRLMRGGS
jgi:hypothetical protein